MKQSGAPLGDVVLPPWAKGDAREFIRAHREVCNTIAVCLQVLRCRYNNFISHLCHVRLPLYLCVILLSCHSKLLSRFDCRVLYSCLCYAINPGFWILYLHFWWTGQLIFHPYPSGVGESQLVPGNTHSLLKIGSCCWRTTGLWDEGHSAASWAQRWVCLAADCRSKVCSFRQCAAAKCMHCLVLVLVSMPLRIVNRCCSGFHVRLLVAVYKCPDLRDCYDWQETVSLTSHLSHVLMW